MRKTCGPGQGGLSPSTMSLILHQVRWLHQKVATSGHQGTPRVGHSCFDIFLGGFDSRGCSVFEVLWRSEFQSIANQYESADGIPGWKGMRQNNIRPEGAQVYKGPVWAVNAGILV